MKLNTSKMEKVKGFETLYVYINNICISEYKKLQYTIYCPFYEALLKSFNSLEELESYAQAHYARKYV